MIRLLRGVMFYASQLIAIAREAANVSSFLRFVTDLLLLRVMRLFNASPSGAERQISLRGGTNLTYRFNAGDIQSIREVWLDEAYKLPFTPESDVLVDLGANIGLTSVWLAKRYQYRTIISVEPSPENARLARINLHNNSIEAEVVEAAVGPSDGSAFFQDEQDSNLGRIASEGREVQMLSMKSILSKLPPGTSVDLVKMDIEGGEEALLRGDLTWLERVHSVIAEFHPTLIDYPQAIETIREAGFNYIASGSAHKDSMDSFVKLK